MSITGGLLLGAAVFLVAVGLLLWFVIQEEQKLNQFFAEVHRKHTQSRRRTKTVEFS